MIATIVLAASLATSPTSTTMQKSAAHIQARPERALSEPLLQERLLQERLLQDFAVTLHPMTEEEKRIFPGRENWDKTEWYEAQFQSVKVMLIPEHVEEWHNGGIDLT